MKRRRLYPGRLFDSDPEAMARGQRKIRARARHWRLLRRQPRPYWADAPDRKFHGGYRAAVRTLREWGHGKREAKLLATRRFSTHNRRRRRHGMRAR